MVNLTQILIKPRSDLMAAKVGKAALSLFCKMNPCKCFCIHSLNVPESAFLKDKLIGLLNTKNKKNLLT